MIHSIEKKCININKICVTLCVKNKKKIKANVCIETYTKRLCLTETLLINLIVKGFSQVFNEIFFLY